MGNPDDATHRKRQGFWLRMAREAAGKKQHDAVAHLGMSAKSTISDYENGVTEIPQKHLRKLATYYGWPLVLFTEPDLTAEEQAQERIAQLARAAIRHAHEDVESGPAAPPDAGVPPAPRLRKRSA